MPTPVPEVKGQLFGWHRPPTHDPGSGTSWTCGTGRHRVRPRQRYALASDRVKPTDPQPVDDGLITGASRLVTFAPSEVPPIRRSRPVARLRDPGHISRKRASDLRKRCRIRSPVVPSGAGSPQERACVHNLWTKLWTDGRTGTRPSAARMMDRETLRGQHERRSRRRHPHRRRPRPRCGAPWSTTSSPTNGPGCAPASRSPCTRHTAIIAVPNDFTRHQLEGRLRTRLEDSLTHAFGQQIRIAVTVNPQLDDGGTPSTSSSRSRRGTRSRPPEEPNRLVDMSPSIAPSGRAGRAAARWRPGSTRSTSSRPS